MNIFLIITSSFLSILSMVACHQEVSKQPVEQQQEVKKEDKVTLTGVINNNHIRFNNALNNTKEAIDLWGNGNTKKSIIDLKDVYNRLPDYFIMTLKD